MRGNYLEKGSHKAEKAEEGSVLVALRYMQGDKKKAARKQEGRREPKTTEGGNIKPGEKKEGPGLQSAKNRQDPEEGEDINSAKVQSEREKVG